MAKQNQYKAQQFIDVIPGTGGIVSAIAKRVGCAWYTAKKYIENYPTIAQAYADECERVLDLAESVIIDGIAAKDTQTAKWYLAMKGIERGYGPKGYTELNAILNLPPFDPAEWKKKAKERLKEVEDLDDPYKSEGDADPE